jgi:hypothetical protein
MLLKKYVEVVLSPSRKVGIELSRGCGGSLVAVMIVNGEERYVHSSHVPRRLRETVGAANVPDEMKNLLWTHSVSCVLESKRDEYTKALWCGTDEQEFVFLAWSEEQRKYLESAQNINLPLPTTALPKRSHHKKKVEVVVVDPSNAALEYYKKLQK